MRFGVFGNGIGVKVVAGALLLSLGACQSGDGGGFLGMGAPKRDPAEDRARITDAELRAYCPRITLPADLAVLSRYRPGAEEDAASLVFRASIGDATRSCTYGEGTLTLNVAAAGRLIPGPASATGPVTLPILIRVVKGGEEIYRNVVQQTVTVASISSPAQFIISEPAITIPQPTAYDVGIFIGFDIPRPETRDDLAL